MGRRFPPPLVGLGDVHRRARVLVDILHDADGPLSRAALAGQARDRITKANGEQYSETYLARTVATYGQIGVIRETSDGFDLYAFADDFCRGDIDAETFLWYAVKRAWVIEGGFPEGIEGLYDVHHVVERATQPLDRPTIRDRLGADHGYEFNDDGIRGYPTLIEAMGAFDATDDGYVTIAPERFTERFRNADLLWQFERWLIREGPTASPPPERVKRDLAKYYMYRESGGHGRHRQLLGTARTDYLDESSLSDTGQPTLERASKYVDHRNRRRRLRDEASDRFLSLSGRDLAGLSIDVLERVANADDEQAARRIVAGAGSGLSRADVEAMANPARQPYTFPEKVDLYDWQSEAADNWFSVGTTAKHEGIAQVVTGAGKTVMALEVLRRWLADDPDRVATVVVPTKVLMNQWVTELVEKLGVPAGDIGWLGDGQKDGFEDGRRILVAIVNSAVKEDRLAASLRTSRRDDHLLIADECHRYTGDTFSNVFDYPRTASLGLSATPLSEPDVDVNDRPPEDELLISELGDIYYRLSYDEGLDRGLIPEFRINYVGFDLTDAEQLAYDRLTDAVVDAITEIERTYQNQLYELDGPFARKLNAIKSSTDESAPAIGEYFRTTRERRELVADAVARQAITLELLQQTVDCEEKAIVFQERIEQLERMVAPKETRGRVSRSGDVADTDIERAQLYDQYPGLEDVDRQLEDLFFRASYRPVMYHSGHRREAWNDFAIEWFRDEGFANVMLSVKALIEGVDVPSADTGIVRVSSGSVRQRIQTLGRVLRTGEDPEDESELYVLYARDTVDANIFNEYDWREELGRAEVRHLTWETEDGGVDGALREATEDEIPEPPTPAVTPDPADLERGDTYEGPDDGFQFSVDAGGEPFLKTVDGRRPIRDEAYTDVAAYVHREKGGGTVTVNESNHATTWIDGDRVFLGVVPDLDTVECGSPDGGGLTGETTWTPGSE